MLPRLALHDLWSLRATCRATRSLVTSSTARVLKAAAKRSGLATTHAVYEQASATSVMECITESALIHQGLKSAVGPEPRCEAEHGGLLCWR